MDPKTILTGLSSAAAVATAFKSLLKSSRGTRRSLLLELKKNLGLLELYARGALPAEKAIAGLDVSRYEAAAQSEFDFNDFNRRPVARETTRGVAALAPYAGWRTEELFESICLKVHAAKSLATGRGPGEARLDLRLANIRRLMVLLLSHIGR